MKGLLARILTDANILATVSILLYKAGPGGEAKQSRQEQSKEALYITQQHTLFMPGYAQGQKEPKATYQRKGRQASQSTTTTSNTQNNYTIVRSH